MQLMWGRSQVHLKEREETNGWGKKGRRKGRRVEEEELRRKKKRKREREGEREGRAKERSEEKGAREGEGEEEATVATGIQAFSHQCVCVCVYLEVVEVQCTVKGEDANHGPGISW